MFLPALLALSIADTPMMQGITSETPAQKAERMRWWRESRFGLFIHWGLYSIPAGKWGDKTGHGEWIRDSAQIPIGEYQKLLSQFNPVKFDAPAWVRMAKDAGMKYIVITTKHHDGFALFDSNHSEWDVMSTPFRRDIMKELSEAARREGLKMGWYHSIMDWNHPDYLPRRGWEEAARPEAGADWSRFVSYLHSQVRELLTSYGDIGVMWFDGEWERTWNHQEGKALYQLCRTLQPNVIINNRVDVGRAGLEGFSETGRYGDFGTPEQTIPDEGIPGLDWETCMTMNNHWGYNAYDHQYKTSKQLIQMLCDIVSKGGNFLLNIGPTAEGEFPKESVERLKDLGTWMRSYGEAIHGTSASPLEKLEWGRCTKKNNTLYLHVFDWPKGGELVIPGIGNRVRNAKEMKGNTPVKVTRGESDIILSVAKGAPDEAVSVIALELEGEPLIYKAPKIVAAHGEFVLPIEVELEAGSPLLEIRYTLDGTTPTANSARYRAPIKLMETTTLNARAFHNGKAVSATSRRTLARAAVWPAMTGLHRSPTVSVFEGNWDKLPDFATLRPTSSQSASEISLGNFAGREHLALRFEGSFTIESTDMYRFLLGSDDGSRLYIDGKLVVDNDGLHSMETREGFAPLAAGRHTIRVDWFNKTGGAELEVKVGRAFSKETPKKLSFR